MTALQRDITEAVGRIRSSLTFTSYDRGSDMTPAAARVRRQLEAWESTRNLYRPSRSTNEDNAGHNYLRNDSATAEEVRRDNLAWIQSTNKEAT